MAQDSLLSNQLSSQQTRLVTRAAIIFVVVALGVSLWLQLYNTQYLRTSVPVTTQEIQLPSSPESKTFSQAAIPFTFKYPANWDVKRTSDAGVTFIDIKPIQIWIYNNATNPEQIVATQALGTNGEQLISWAGKLGSATGTYWARASVYNGTQAPYGSRAFITASSSSTAVVLLPQPPYTTGEQRFIDSFSPKAK